MRGTGGRHGAPRWHVCLFGARDAAGRAPPLPALVGDGGGRDSCTRRVERRAALAARAAALRAARRRGRAWHRGAALRRPNARQRNARARLLRAARPDRRRLFGGDEGRAARPRLRLLGPLLLPLPGVAVLLVAKGDRRRHRRRRAAHLRGRLTRLAPPGGAAAAVHLLRGSQHRVRVHEHRVDLHFGGAWCLARAVCSFSAE
mmetsp:Transcript_32539/g.104131  ORF Transcript_32539/g.104131 Transcript_32539/m.104131 type:complete len:203 (+) Transcript_32539:703-1311(+)